MLSTGRKTVQVDTQSLNDQSVPDTIVCWRISTVVMTDKTELTNTRCDDRRCSGVLVDYAVTLVWLSNVALSRQ